MAGFPGSHSKFVVLHLKLGHELRARPLLLSEADSHDSLEIPKSD